MDYSAANTSLWTIIIQLGYMAGAILVCNLLRNKVKFVRDTTMPVAVMAGFILLILKCLNIIKLDAVILEDLVYHGIALGFIAMSLRVADKATNKDDKAALKSGCIIVSTYLVQGLSGLFITILLGFTFMPGLFKASGILLPMGYGQGPGQANNIGSSYQALGFEGGHSFALALAAAGYLCACIVGVFLLNSLKRRGKIQAGTKHDESELSVSFFQDKNEIPVADSVDRLSVQLALVLLTYLLTYLVTKLITSAASAAAPGVAATVNTLLWGFNFIVGSVLAILLKSLLDLGRRHGVMERQYQNNYLLNRISGFFFDIMIVAGIASINPEELSGLWVPFILLAVAGGILTWIFLKTVCKWAYADYYYEGLLSMYGMLTGTISSGILLLREIDNDFETPAANNLVSGSSVAILFGVPVLLLVTMAAKGDGMCLLTFAISAVYFAILIWLLRRLCFGKKK